MKDHKNDRNIERENISLGQSFAFHNLPDDQLEDAILEEDLCTEEHSSQRLKDHPSEQVCGGEDAMHPRSQEFCSKKTASSRKPHNDHFECAKSCLLQVWKTPQEAALIPPSSDFRWTQDDWFSLYYKDNYAGIQIRPLQWGVYLIILGNDSFIEVPTLRQALAICHNIAWIFRDSLPVPKRYVNTNAQEPSNVWP